MNSPRSKNPGKGTDADQLQARREPLRKATGEAIRDLRQARRMSPKTLAQRSGLSYSWVLRLESGRHEPTFESMRCLARGLGLSLAELAKKIEDFDQS